MANASVKAMTSATRDYIDVAARFIRLAVASFGDTAMRLGKRERMAKRQAKSFALAVSGRRARDDVTGVIGRPRSMFDRKAPIVNKRSNWGKPDHRRNSAVTIYAP
jgi:hypothetical protein